MSAWNAAALMIADAEWMVSHLEHLRRCESPLYTEAAREQAEATLLALLLDVREALDARLLLLRPPAAPAEGDAPPALPERPVPKFISQSVHC